MVCKVLYSGLWASIVSPLYVNTAVGMLRYRLIAWNVIFQSYIETAVI